MALRHLHISIQAEDFDLGDESERLLERVGGGDAGAQCSFAGRVRESEKLPGQQGASADSLLALEIEHYPAMTASAIETICHDASARWPLIGVSVIHRYGELTVGEQIVLVLVVAEHRQAAFSGCEYIMDYLKTRAPFWKKARFARL